MQYEYDSIVGGFRWNLIQKISIALGIPISQISSADTYGVNAKTYIDFNGIELTPEQKATMDSIITTNPCTIPTNTIGNTTFKIADIWKSRKWLIDQFSVPATVWWDAESEDGSTPCYAHFLFPQSLTVSQKSDIKKILTGVTEV